jgi:hypothetical protein
MCTCIHIHTYMHTYLTNNHISLGFATTNRLHVLPKRAGSTRRAHNFVRTGCAVTCTTHVVILRAGGRTRRTAHVVGP